MVLTSFVHESYQYEDLIDSLSITRDTSRNPLFDVMFSYFKEEEVSENSLAGLISAYEGLDARVVSKFDISMVVVEGKEQLHISFNYNKRLFKEITMSLFMGYLKTIVSSVLSNPDQLISEITILDKEEKEALLSLSTGVISDVIPTNVTVLDLFKDQVKQRGNEIALELGEERLSYKELGIASDCLAAYLQAEGVEKGMMVGLYMERSIEMIIGILGILKSGGSYMPMNPEQPVLRTIHMLSDSGSKHILINCSIASNFYKDYKITDLRDSRIFEDYKSVTPAIIKTEIAYTIYTSGSTGYPKGVLIGHDSLFNYIQGQKTYFEITSKDAILQFSPIYFDASVEQLWLSLTSGARLVLVAKETLLDSKLFVTYLAEKSITHLHSTPSFLSMLSLPENLSLRNIVSAGERCSSSLASKYISSYRFYNKYGPTETTISALEHEVTVTDIERGVIPIGRPIANTQVYILDAYGTVLPKGSVGELYIGGAGVSRGYLNNEGLTREYFVENPFIKGEMMYRTGDLGRWLPEGTIEFIGRKDSQVKIRGHRIELGEIINQVESHAEVGQSVVVVNGIGSDQYLVCYYTSTTGIESSELESYLQEILP
ncbi:amino acid adenylation domain-containing protein, partial [uncultured Tenacibaculum sp.]